MLLSETYFLTIHSYSDVDCEVNIFGSIYTYELGLSSRLLRIVSCFLILGWRCCFFLEVKVFLH